MDNSTPEPILELAGKYSADVIDYVVDLSAYLGDGASLMDVSVEIDAAGNGESPPELSVTDAQAYATESGGLERAVLFYLEGGTSGVRYRGLIRFGDDQTLGSPSATRRRSKRFYVVVS